MSFDGSDFGHNNKLCGKPLGSKCGGLSSKSLAIIVATNVVGAAVSLFIGFVIWWWFFLGLVVEKAKAMVLVMVVVLKVIVVGLSYLGLIS